jgi:hypothetical protein
MTEITDILRAELGRLAVALEPHGIPLIIGGGYGLLLRQEHLEHSDIRTVRRIPEARSTNDLDVFLSAEILTDARKMGSLRDVLHRSGYAPIKGAEHYQFEKEVTYRGSQRRILDPGGAGEFRVRIPHPYSFLLLKLYAYRDRRDDPATELGRYHAFDLYRIVAMMTEEEYETAQGFRDRFGGEEVVVEARRIVSDLFADVDSRGTLALLEHARTVGVTIRDEDLDGFLEDLKFFFPALT